MIRPLSTCCSAPALGELQGMTGHCSDCGDPAGFELRESYGFGFEPIDTTELSRSIERVDAMHGLVAA